ncbi:M20/M25/M40 family metallo-hydrolase [Campylobacter hepaticus]|uniref:M20/M25/M40 family metallo-hydrolase n=1 Tax=Campylobacter hepaticus TaxID=1813019 RepID=UPI0018C9953A|nr:M20/M25/M40 family metallo-hydrolase [Campylobacter hepaticus]MCZ0772352.1 M20/M25/M40 family metallo-hydrolase [Campylobacter hepaticus]MCZ0773820.1 M20/M25/M40 family metallo-hydrolase [Campylobacter hepaticus]MCZ0775071.1 M20/M25/M40 family metallo-hydrolase [Campylobacter hepaticus]QPM44340.1 M20/M25/M40 family metallo-hydrolase [Campylobacter hepaticus]WAP50238.1 M20/M25/M40 family metallo-hydrolase [Campylobacter hepaticus]
MQNVIENFKQLCQIPHCSYETKQMQEFLSSYAQDKGFKVNIDKAGNIHAIKGKPHICLQSHYDMVCMGNAPKLEVYEENGFLKAKDSSLGADNGIGIAIMMSAMDTFKDLECLFTNDEEVGLIGVNLLEHHLESQMLLNLDHENDNEVMIGCAGGVDIKANLNFDTSKRKGKIYELQALNFKGGHSGINIISNNRNSIKEMAKFIKENDGEIISFNGGERINSIPKHAQALVYFKNEVQSSKYIKCTFKEEGEFEICNQSTKILDTINAFSHGVRAYDEKLNIVQTSINLATLKMYDKQIELTLFARSNVLDDLKQIEFESLEFFKAFGYEVKSFNFYPPWEGEINELSTKVLKVLKKFSPQAKISAIHAGLECGILEKKQKLLCASIGPNIYNPHSTDERCEINSIQKISQVVFEVLKDKA